MRGRILTASFLAAAVLLTACSRKDSLYIDTSKDGPAPAEASNAKPAAPPAAAPTAAATNAEAAPATR